MAWMNEYIHTWTHILVIDICSFQGQNLGKYFTRYQLVWEYYSFLKWGSWFIWSQKFVVGDFDCSVDPVSNIVIMWILKWNSQKYHFQMNLVLLCTLLIAQLCYRTVMALWGKSRTWITQQVSSSWWTSSVLKLISVSAVPNVDAFVSRKWSGGHSWCLSDEVAVGHWGIQQRQPGTFLMLLILSFSIL